FQTIAGGPLYGQLWKQYADSVKFYITQKLPDKAYSSYRKAKEAGPADIVFTDTITPALQKLAELFFSTGDPGQAITAGNELKMLISRDHSDSTREYASACNILGSSYNVMGKLDTARAFYLKAKEIREKLLGTNDPLYAQSCNNLGSLYRDYGQFDEAEV